MIKLKVVITTTLVLLFLSVLAIPAIASLQDDLKNENLSMVTVFERAIADGLAISDIVRETIETDPTNSTTALAAAIVVVPESIPEIVTAAASIKTRSEVVGVQCKSVLTSEMVGQIIVSAIDNEFKPEVIFRLCLPALRQEEVTGVVVSALTVADESIHTSIISAAFNAIGGDDTNNVTLLAGDLVQSLAGQDFQSSMTASDIMELSAVTSTTAPSSNTEPPVQVVIIVEPPASDS